MADINQTGIKQRNRNDIFRFIYENKRVTKQQIMQELGLSLPTVLQNLSDMQGEGFVGKSGSFSSTGGRRATGFSVTGDAKYAVGVDINRSHIAVVAVSLDGTILSVRHEHCKFENSDTHFKKVASLTDEVIASISLPPDRLLGVGLSVQGVISPDGEEIEYSPILGMTGEPCHLITDYIHYPCVLLHDADMAAFAEVWNAPELGNAVYISLSTNLGGSVIIDRTIYNGDGSFAGKLEHMTLFPNGEPCYCGRFGCAEAYCAVTWLLERSGCADLRSFFEKLRNHCGECTAIWNQYISNLSILLNNINTLFDCEIILGGYMAEYLEPFGEEIKQLSYGRDSFGAKRDYLRVASCINEPVAYGAAIYYISDFIDNF